MKGRKKESEREGQLKNWVFFFDIWTLFHIANPSISFQAKNSIQFIYFIIFAISQFLNSIFEHFLRSYFSVCLCERERFVRFVLQ